MLNPWLKTPAKPPFVLTGDAPFVEAHNARCTRWPSTQLNLTLRPEPYVGLPDSPLVLLTLNPGDRPGDKEGQSNSIFQRLNRENLHHQCNYYYLDPHLPDCPGKAYNQRQLKAVLQRLPPEAIMRNLFLVQFLPYHSAEYKGTGVEFPSQEYSRFLVRQAMRRNALIVVLRSRTLWFSVIPELAGYRHMLECSNPRSPTVSPRSLGDEGFEKVLKQLRLK